MRPAPVIVALLLAGALVGCGGGDSDGDSALTDYLPADVPAISLLDVDDARSELGLPDDADAIDLELFEEDEPDQDLLTLNQYVATTAPVIGIDPATFEPSPAGEAIDGAAIERVAGDIREAATIETSQSFDDLAAGLEDAGFERGEDDALTLTGEEPEDTFEVADAGDGVIVVTRGEQSAGELVSEPPGGPQPLADLIAVDATFATGAGTTDVDGEESGNCQLAVGGSQSADGTEGALLIELDAEADPERVEADAIAEPVSELTPGTPEVDGTTVEVPFTGPAVDFAGDPVTSLLASFVSTKVYPCEEG